MKETWPLSESSCVQLHRSPNQAAWHPQILHKAPLLAPRPSAHWVLDASRTRLIHWARADCLHDFPPEMWEHCFDHFICDHKDKLAGARVHSYFYNSRCRAEISYLHLFQQMASLSSNPLAANVPLSPFFPRGKHLYTARSPAHHIWAGWTLGCVV